MPLYKITSTITVEASDDYVIAGVVFSLRMKINNMLWSLQNLKGFRLKIETENCENEKMIRVVK